MSKKKMPPAADVRRSTPRDKIRLPDSSRRAGSARSVPPSSPGVSGRSSGPVQNAPAPSSSGNSDSVLASAEPYRLKTKAVEDLVTANEDNSPPVPVSELRKYHAGPKMKLADWVKAVLLKWWIGGMICYFFVWGLSTLTINPWDHLLVLGIALGLVTNLITSNIFRFIAKTPGAYNRWMMFPGKSLLFLPADLLYASLLVMATLMTYNGVNLLLAGGSEGSAAVLGVEPILFGAFITLWDLLFLGVKHLLLRIFSDAKQKAAAEARLPGKN